MLTASLLIIGSILVIYLFLFGFGKKKPPGRIPFPDLYRELLLRDLPFYQRLDEQRRDDFEQRMMRFLSRTRIIGVKTTVEETDKAYIAASAIMPIFGFGDWEYNNLDEVLLYPASFSRDFEQTGEGRNILGIVGEGALQRVMVISQQELRQAFLPGKGKENTAVHEFVHLIDKSDGATDGVPGFFLEHAYTKPWLQLMHKEIQAIHDNHSDINPYGATNEAEFFAVASEYFFERPDLLEKKHPELYSLLSKAFHQDADQHIPNQK